MLSWRLGPRVLIFEANVGQNRKRLRILIFYPNFRGRFHTHEEFRPNISDKGSFPPSLTSGSWGRTKTTLVTDTPPSTSSLDLLSYFFNLNVTSLLINSIPPFKDLVRRVVVNLNPQTQVLTSNAYYFSLRFNHTWGSGKSYPYRSWSSETYLTCNRYPYITCWLSSTKTTAV